MKESCIMKKLQSYMLVLSLLVVQSAVLQGMLVRAAKQYRRPTRVQGSRPVSITISTSETPEKLEIPEKITKTVEVLPTLPPKYWFQKIFGIRPSNPEYFAILRAVEAEAKGYNYSDDDSFFIYYSAMKSRDSRITRKITGPILSTLPQNRLQKLFGIQRPNPEYFAKLRAIEAEENGYSFSQDDSKLAFYSMIKSQDKNPRTIIAEISPTLPQNWLQKRLGIQRHNPEYYARLEQLGLEETNVNVSFSQKEQIIEAREAQVQLGLWPQQPYHHSNIRWSDEEDIKDNMNSAHMLIETTEKSNFPAGC